MPAISKCKLKKIIKSLKEENHILRQYLHKLGIVDIGFWNEKGEYRIDLQEVQNGNRFRFNNSTNG